MKVTTFYLILTIILIHNFDFLDILLGAKDLQALLQPSYIEKTAEIPCPPTHLCQAKQLKMALQNPDLIVPVQNPDLTVREVLNPDLTQADPVLAIRLTVGDIVTLQCL